MLAVLRCVMKKIQWLWPIMASMVFGACDTNSNQMVSPDKVTVRNLPIINGKRVTGDNWLSTVALVIEYWSGSYSAICTGTLISPSYVMTAGHCVAECKGDEFNPADYLSMMRVGIGQSENSLRKVYEIEAVYPHPNFVCTQSTSGGAYIDNDIAIIKLKKPVPISEVTPSMVISPNLDMTPSEVDSGKVTTTAVGFGKTNAYSDTSGTKYETNLPVFAYCPVSRSRSSKCSYSFAQRHFIFTYSDTTGTCQGDSGGPLFWKKNDINYVVGITSYGPEGCLTYSAFTMVSDYYDFITSHVDDLAAALPETCDNNVDDNDDGRVDCKDPYCFGVLRCIPEDCGNKKDDNGNGDIDCDDAQCTDAIVCQPEICDDGKDNNGNEFVDCNDPDCYDELICQPEICDDKRDNNGNNLIDCDDPQCTKALVCQPEICDNDVDDNGNDLTDCDDPECEQTTVCLPEICDNNVDDNGDRLIDCNDPKCRKALVCQPEICNDDKDNNGNDLIDCADPQCANAIRCQPEICDDGKDNNDNGLMDCDDPECAEESACSSHGGASGCSALPDASGSSGMMWPISFALLAMLGWRRRKTQKSC